MRKLFFCAIFTLTLCSFYSCGGGSNNKSNEKTTESEKNEKSAPIDFRILTNETEFKKYYNIAFEKLGDNVKHVGELSFSMSRGSEETHPDEDAMDYLTVKIQYLHPKNQNKLQEYSYWTTTHKWADSPTTVTVSPIGDPERFRLEDHLMDLSSLTFDKVNKAVQDTYDKYKNEEKYTYQYVSSVIIEDGEITIFVNGKLKANDLIKFELSKIKL